MTNEELVELIQAGERDRLPELWEQVERFAAMQARRMARRLEDRHDLTVEDLYQCGYLALAAAVSSFSAEADKSFLGWFDFYLKMEFAVFGGWRTKRQRNDPIRRAASLEAPADADEGGGSALGDLQADPAAGDAFLDVEERDRLERLRSAVETALQALPETQRDIVQARFWRELTLKDTAAALGLSVKRARQQEAKAIRTLRHPQISRELLRHWE